MENVWDAMAVDAYSGKRDGLRIGRHLLALPIIMTFLLLVAFYRNQEVLDENPNNFFGGKFVSPNELNSSNFTDQFVVIAVVVKGKPISDERDNVNRV